MNHYQFRGPRAGRDVVEAWAVDYIRFDNLPPWQKELRTEIRSGCQQLPQLTAGRVLHATLAGPKPPNTDIENLLLYNIGSFRESGASGIRFEHGDGAPPAPDGQKYQFHYWYGLTPRSGGFAYWRPAQTLASFDWIDLGAFAGEKKLAQVWWALHQGVIAVGSPMARETPFALRIHIRPPHGRRPVLGNLVKGIFDGIICALQCHTEIPVAPEVLERLSAQLRATPTEIEGLLLDSHRAVLGGVPRLVAQYGSGVKWYPSDHLCVAGELLVAEAKPSEDRWAIKGDVVGLTR